MRINLTSVLVDDQQVPLYRDWQAIADDIRRPCFYESIVFDHVVLVLTCLAVQRPITVLQATTPPIFIGQSMPQHVPGEPLVVYRRADRRDERRGEHFLSAINPPNLRE